MFDITKEKEQRIQIENAQRSIAKEQERVKFAQEFSELLSHEVRNPLASIDSCALLTSNSIDGLIKRTSLRDSCHHDSNETQGNGYLQEGLVAIKEDIGQIMNCTDYIKCVVENTLDLVKLRLHRLELNYTVVDLERDVLEPTTQMFRRTHQAVEIYTVCESKIKIRCDAFRLRQILVNLVNNGIKHTPNGYIRIVALRNSPQMVTIAVEDTGTVSQVLINLSRLSISIRAFHQSSTERCLSSMKKLKRISLGMVLDCRYAGNSSTRWVGTFALILRIQVLRMGLAQESKSRFLTKRRNLN